MLNILNWSRLVQIIIGAILAISIVIVPMVVSAQAVDQSSKDAACEGLAVGGSGCNNTSGSSISNLIASAINILSWIVGLAAVIMLIVGGFKYVISGGDANAVSSAKNTILYAIIGLAIAVLAQGIVQFVLKEVTTP